MKKVLVIDDERPTLNMFRLLLGAYGYHVLTAEDGSEGLKVFRNEKPRIVITDVKMPGTDGLEVLRSIKAMDPKAEVIVITGHGDMDLAIKALNLDATDFINKPLQRSALDSALRRAEERIRSTNPQVNNISLRMKGEITVMDVEGNLTDRSQSILMDVYEKATEKGAKQIVIVFRENATINGSGISTLLELLAKTRKRNQRVAISGLSENFNKIFDMVGITRLAKVFENEEEAMESVRVTN